MKLSARLGFITRLRLCLPQKDRWKWGVVLLSLVFHGFFLSAQPAAQLRFIHLGAAQGLPPAEPTSIFQDSYGFIWIGTKDGLYRFDGYECTAFKANPDDPFSLSSNYVSFHAFHEDRYGNLWIATFEDGFLMFDRQTEKFYRFQENLAVPNWLTCNAINAICGDGKNGIWIGTKGKGLNHYDIGRDSFTIYWDRSGKPDTLMGSSLLLGLRLTRNGVLWMGTLTGAATLDPHRNFRRFRGNPAHKDSLSAGFVMDIFEDDKGNVWLATQNGLNRWDEQNQRFIRYFPENQPGIPKGFNYVQRVFQDSDRGFWIGTAAGLLRFFSETGQFELVPHLPLDPASIFPGGIHGILEDNRKRLWFLGDGGACILDKNTARFNEERALGAAFFPTTSQLEGVIDVAEAGGKFWFSTSNGLFSKLPGEPQRQVLSGIFSALFVDRQGLLHAGVQGTEYWVVEPVSGKVVRRVPKIEHGLDTQKVAGIHNLSFEQDKKGRFWIGMAGFLNNFDPATGKYRQFVSNHDLPESLSNGNVNDLLFDRLGNLWIATLGGVNRLTPGEAEKAFEGKNPRFLKFRHEPGNPNSLSHNQVYAIFEDGLGRLWFGTEVGLNCFDPVGGKWRRFFVKDGLPDEKITAITADPAGNIWIGTGNKGLAKYDVSSRRFTCFSTRNGLNTNQFNRGACLKTSDGKLVFGGVYGINCFDPARVDLPSQPAPLYFTELRLDNQPVRIGGEDGLLRQPIYLTPKIVLAPHQKVVTLRFATLDFLHSEKWQYRYKLEGFDKSWQYLGSRREVTFTNLFPGSYLLQVQGSSNGYAWDTASASLAIQVKIPPLWIFLAVVFAGILYVFFRFRLRQKLAAAEARRLQDLDAVKNRLYTNITHEFRTPLTLILGEAERLESSGGVQPAASGTGGGLNPAATIRRNGRQLLNLVNQMLDLAKLESGNLHLKMAQGDVIAFLKYLLESFYSLAEAKKIDLRFECRASQFVMDFDEERLRQIVSNLLSNAIKFTPPGGRVTLHVNHGDFQNHHDLTRLHLTVSDTGAGIPPENLPRIFDRFYQVDDSATRHAEGTGIGLTLTRELVKLLGGSIEVESQMGKGTTFTVRLPISNKAAATKNVGRVQNPADVGGAATKNVGRVQNPADVGGAATKNVGRVQNPADVGAAQILKSSLPQILLVEDNADVRRYVSSILAKNYRVETAENGKTGLQKALNLEPDLILSDVMMPEMDGYELCQILKNDLRTSHVPVVLLTAKADFDSRLEGLEQGADAYLAKPFEQRELEIVLRKLLENREKLRRHFTSAEFLGGGFASADSTLSAVSPSADASADSTLSAVSTSAPLRLNPQDEQFFQRLLAKMETHLDDYDLSAERLAGLLNLSYSALHRKIKSLTGMGVTEYVRHFRLHRAAQLLLEKPDWTVTQVGLEVGFENLQFFSREFKKTMGCTASEWRQRKLELVKSW